MAGPGVVIGATYQATIGADGADGIGALRALRVGFGKIGNLPGGEAVLRDGVGSEIPGDGPRLDEGAVEGHSGDGAALVAWDGRVEQCARDPR